MNKTILLVEDEIIIAMTQIKSLERYEYKVIHVTSGEKAISLMSKPNNIDLILMDINLENTLDGIETAEIILRKSDIPIVFVSSHTEKEIVEKTERVTSYGYVVKSSGIIVLDASIKMAFKLFEAKRTAEKHEHACFEGEERLKEVLEYSLNASYKRNLIKEHYEYLSPVFEKISGYSLDDVINLPDEDVYPFTHPDDYEMTKETIRKSNKDRSNTPYQMEYRFKHKDGHYFWMLNKFIVLHDEKGKALFRIGSISDITDRKKIEENLIAIASNMERAERAVKIGNWKIDLNTNTVTGSKGAREIYELDGDSSEFSQDLIHSRVLPEYAEKSDKAMKDLIKKDIPYDVTAKIKTFKENIKTVRSIAEYDKKENIVFGVIQDITRDNP